MGQKSDVFGFWLEKKTLFPRKIFNVQEHNLLCTDNKMLKEWWEEIEKLNPASHL